MAGIIPDSFVRLTEAILPASAVEALRRPVTAWRKRRNRRRRALRERFWHAQAGQGKTVFEVQPDVRLNLHFDSELCRLIFLNDFEAEERRFMNLFLRPRDTFVDVGANIGLFSLIAARLVGPEGHAYAFEPCSRTFGRLQENIRLNQFENVSCLQLALSDAAGEMEMAVSAEGLDAWNSFARPYVGDNFHLERVKMTTWDDFAAHHRLTGKVAMMKIDVEGWEERALRGTQREFARPDAPVLQVEFTDAAANAAGLSCRSVYRYLKDMGFEVCRFDAREDRLVPEPPQEAYPYCNLFAVKNRPMVQARLDAKARALRNK